MVSKIDSYTLEITVGNDTYYCYAGFGTTNRNKPGWAIRKVSTRTTTVGEQTITEKTTRWASGNDNCDKVANQYASYTYQILSV